MSWSYRKRVRIIPGVHINISKSGISTSIGLRGASITIKKDGIYSNTGIPGTGIYNRQKIHSFFTPQDKTEIKLPAQPIVYTPTEMISVSSGPTANLTTQRYQGIIENIKSIDQERAQLKLDLVNIKKDKIKTINRRTWSKVLIYGFLHKKTKNKFVEELQKQDEAIDYIEKQLKDYKLKLDYTLEPIIEEKYRTLLNSFQSLTGMELIWDITDYKRIDRVRERSYASTTVNPVKVQFNCNIPESIFSAFKVMHFENANGGDIYFFPTFVMIYNTKENFAIIGYEELNLVFAPMNFVKTGGVPKDSKVIEYTWQYVNKNGSRDLRFKNNFQIPVIRMGGFILSSTTGLLEQYLFSNYEATMTFNNSLIEYQEYLKVSSS